MYVYVYDCLCVGFSPLSGASYKALNFFPDIVDSALLGFDIRVAQQKQGRDSAEALISLSPLKHIEVIRPRCLMKFYLFIYLRFGCNKFTFPLHLH